MVTAPEADALVDKALHHTSLGESVQALSQDACFGVELGSTSLTLFVSDEGHSGRLRLSPFYSLAHREDAR